MPVRLRWVADYSARSAAISNSSARAYSSQVVPDGAFEELLATAERQGTVTPEEIAEILDTDAIPVQAETQWSVGGE